MIVTVLVVLLILMLLGALPGIQSNINMGYAPSGLLGLVLVILLILYLCGRV